MTIQFNNIPNTVRTPGVYVEVDNSRALQGLVQNPHRVLLIGQKIAAGTKPTDSLIPITRDGLADGYFGPGSILARMCNTFKENNENTELYAMAVSDAGAGVAASGTIQISVALSHNGFSCSGTGSYNLLVNGVKCYTVLTSGWSTTDCNSAIVDTVNADSTLPITASTNATSAINLIAVNVGELGNDLDARVNYYLGESDPVFFGDSAPITSFANGANNPDIGDAWAVIDGELFQHICQPYTDASNLTEIEDEFDDRWLPLEDLRGHGYTAHRGTAGDHTTLGNSRNNEHNSIMGFYDSPTSPEEWAAAVCAVASWNLNNDPARPLHFLDLQGVLAPPEESRFTRAERDVLLYDGIATFRVDSGGDVLIERLITTYQTNALGLPDPSYLDIQTLFTCMEISFQYKTRMSNRFLIPRFKLADDGYPVTAGQYMVTPKTIREETLALFHDLWEIGLIENIDDFKTNLKVERDITDRNRVNVLLPADLVNQFRVLAGNLQFIL